MGGGVRYIGEWGSLGPKVKGIVTYSLSPFEQKPLTGILSKGIFNVYRRFTSEFLNFAPGLLPPVRVARCSARHGQDMTGLVCGARASARACVRVPGCGPWCGVTW